jgi:hypothetical protein
MDYYICEEKAVNMALFRYLRTSALPSLHICAMDGFRIASAAVFSCGYERR